MRAQELQRPIRSELYTSDLFLKKKLNRNDKKKKDLTKCVGQSTIKSKIKKISRKKIYLPLAS